MKISVGVHGRYHGFDLARELSCLGHNVDLLTTYPKFIARRFVGSDINLRTIPRLEILRRGSQKLGLNCEAKIARDFAEFLSRNIYDSEIIFGWSSASLEAIEAAHRKGSKFILERGSAHILVQNNILQKEYERLGIKWDGIDKEIMAREIEEYAKADIICVGSKYSANTFISQGIDHNKIYVNQYGVNLSSFRSSNRTNTNQVLKILFAGTVGIRKGIPILLEAFAKIKTNVELHIIGNLEESIKAIIKKNQNNNIKIRGPLPSTLMPEEFYNADIFCLPSIEEGFGMVILQAMAAGLPVIASDVTGGLEVIRDGEDGILVPAGNSDKLAEGLEFLIANPDIRLRMGNAAREKTLQGWDWANYGQRANTLINMITKAE